MAITLDQSEIDSFLAQGHTVIFTTIDAAGYPHAAPLWYVYLDGAIYVRTLARSLKAKNIARNNKVCCLVESGERWRDLNAVIVRGHANAVTDDAALARIQAALDAKYSSFRETRQALPQRTQQHYSQSRVFFKVTPDKPIASWDNRKLRLTPG